MSNYELNEMYKKFEHERLLREAVYVDSKRGDGELGVRELCEKMSEISKGSQDKSAKPAKSNYEGFTFVVDRDSSVEDVLQAWKEQAYKPYLEKDDNIERMTEALRFTSEGTSIGSSVSSYIAAATVDVLVAKYPEEVKKLNMLQLLNAFEKSTKRNVDAVGAALIENAVRYTKGEETFPPTLANMVTLDEHKDQLVFALGVGVNSNKLNDRIKESELEMLNNLKPEDLRAETYQMLCKVGKIAQKHDRFPGEYSSIITNECLRRLPNPKTISQNI